MADDLQVLGGVGQQRVVEPDQVLAHQPAREVVGGSDRLPLCAYPAFVPDPSEAPHHRPFVEPYRIGRVLLAVGGRIEGKLPARVVEHEVVGLAGGVHPAAELARLDEVHPDPVVRLAGADHRSFEHAQAPGTEPDDGEFDHRPVRGQPEGVRRVIAEPVVRDGHLNFMLMLMLMFRLTPAPCSALPIHHGTPPSRGRTSIYACLTRLAGKLVSRPGLDLRGRIEPPQQEREGRKRR